MSVPDFLDDDDDSGTADEPAVVVLLDAGTNCTRFLFNPAPNGVKTRQSSCSSM